MPNESDYVPGPVQGFAMKVGGCEFVAWLPMRKAGGFDLCLDREASELECLRTDQITWLRQQAAGDNVVLVSRLEGAALDKSVKLAAQQRLGQWLQQQFGLSWTADIRATWTELESFR